jgi:RimJ/RimL family protein N-acetyltransferase
MRIDTERLILRPPRLDDAPGLFAFLGDPTAMAHTHVDASLRACRRRIAVHERRRRRDGFAPWTIVTKHDGRIIGWGGMYEDPFDPGWGVEVGYFFHPDAWGPGYASELLAATLAYADAGFDLPEIRAFAHPDNAGSRRVLQKAGFACLRHVPEMNRFLFGRRRPDGA